MKKMIKKISYVLLSLILLASVGFYLAIRFSPNSVSNIYTAVASIGRSYPKDFKEAKKVTLTCNYHGKQLAVSETLYGNVEEFYQSEPRKRADFYQNNNKAFVFNYEQDKTLDDLTGKIKQIGTDNKLNSDQTLDVAACLMQSIPYDELKARKVLSNNSYSFKEIVPRYPYETLYDFTGICTDKSYLGAAIFSRMGYKTALLDFDKERHMSIGVGVPVGFGELGTEYGIMELTGEGFLVGDVPSLKADIGLAQTNLKNLPEINSNSVDTSASLSTLGSPSKIEALSSGGIEYRRIVERTSLVNSIQDLSSQLTVAKTALLASQNKLKDATSSVQTAESKYQAQKTQSSYQQYLTVYSSYSVTYNQVNAEISAYNVKVKKYNQLIEQYKSY